MNLRMQQLCFLIIPATMHEAFLNHTPPLPSCEQARRDEHLPCYFPSYCPHLPREPLVSGNESWAVQSVRRADAADQPNQAVTPLPIATSSVGDVLENACQSQQHQSRSHPTARADRRLHPAHTEYVFNALIVVSHMLASSLPPLFSRRKKTSDVIRRPPACIALRCAAKRRPVYLR